MRERKKRQNACFSKISCASAAATSAFGSESEEDCACDALLKAENKFFDVSVTAEKNLRAQDKLTSFTGFSHNTVLQAPTTLFWQEENIVLVLQTNNSSSYVVQISVSSSFTHTGIISVGEVAKEVFFP
jgi:hypothetical protein